MAAVPRMGIQVARSLRFFETQLLLALVFTACSWLDATAWAASVVFFKFALNFKGSFAKLTFLEALATFEAAVPAAVCVVAERDVDTTASSLSANESRIIPAAVKRAHS